MSKTRFCAVCGEALKKNPNFCPECGTSTHSALVRRPPDTGGFAERKSAGGPRVGSGTILVLALIALAVFWMWWRGFFIRGDSPPEGRAESVFWKNTLDKAQLIEADALLLAYEEDPAQANERFDRKVLAVRGSIAEVSTSGLYVEFQGAGDRRLRCSLQGGEAEKLAGLNVGDAVTVSGLCVGVGKYDDRVHLRRCRLRR